MSVDSDSFDFDQFDETNVHDDEEDFDINSMPDPYANAPDVSVEAPAPAAPAAPAPAPAEPAAVQSQAPAAYETAMMDAAGMAMDTVRRANELAQQNAQEQENLDQRRLEQMAQMEQQHSEEMEEMRRKVEALEEENASLAAGEGMHNSAKSLMSTAESLLPTIERIRADDDTALENAAEIELLKKLLELCEYLPEDEKAEFMSSPIRMKMEYLIARLSGEPGLLKTALSLKKAGVLGEENVVFQPQKTFSVTNHELRKVFKCMKNLSDSLDDTYLADAMCNRIDNVLEKIELAEHSIQIF